MRLATAKKLQADLSKALGEPVLLRFDGPSGYALRIPGYDGPWLHTAVDVKRSLRKLPAPRRP